ncbi:hypothetical protein L596_001117 [Steinernema carpocapsae]|uniref:Uncharacterized protein n=1 Tax=Steinernema carpocapsae TaxID=34508 RepID=A0A4U8UMQ1_STECR|nr:hypothetical protein L596_001117 [Steinernema carpocapsae]
MRPFLSGRAYGVTTRLSSSTFVLIRCAFGFLANSLICVFFAYFTLKFSVFFRLGSSDQCTSDWNCDKREQRN